MQDASVSAATLGAGHAIASKVTGGIQSAVKFDVQAIKSMGSGVGNKNIIKMPQGIQK